MRFMKLAVTTGNPKAPWSTIFNTLRGLEFYGHKEGVEIYVDVIDRSEPGCYFAWLDADGSLKYVRATLPEVSVALGITRASNLSLGRIVYVRITPVIEVAEAVETTHVQTQESDSYASAIQNATRLAA
jgi:hypothetical protein